MNSVFPYANLNFKKKKIGKPQWKKLFSTDNLKVGVLFGVFMGLTLVYVITINISSTRGYYYDQMIRKQRSVDFTHNVSKLKNLSFQSKLWDNANFGVMLRDDTIQDLIIE